MAVYYLGYVGIMEKKMETTIYYNRVFMGVIVPLKYIPKAMF